MKPTTNRLLVRVVKEGETPKGNKVLTAEVIKAGPEAAFNAVGKRVVFSPFGFDEVEVNNKETGLLETLVIVSEDMILAVYEE